MESALLSDSFLVGPCGAPSGLWPLFHILNVKIFIAPRSGPRLSWLTQDTQTGYRSFINMSQAVEYFLLVEFTKNPDGYRGSNYMYKDRGGLLMFGPPWVSGRKEGL